MFSCTLEVKSNNIFLFSERKVVMSLKRDPWNPFYILTFLSDISFKFSFISSFPYNYHSSIEYFLTEHFIQYCYIKS